MTDITEDNTRIALLLLEPKRFVRVIRLNSVDDELRQEDLQHIIDLLVLHTKFILRDEVLHLPSFIQVLLRQCMCE